MSDQPAQPFSPFAPTPAPKFAADPAPAGQEKKPAKKRAKKAGKAKKAAPKKKRIRQITGITISGTPTKAEVHTAPVPTRKRTRKPRPTMIPIGILPALGGLSEAETSMLMSIIGNMQDLPKRSRAKIVKALGKVFA